MNCTCELLTVHEKVSGTVAVFVLYLDILTLLSRNKWRRVIHLYSRQQSE